MKRRGFLAGILAAGVAPAIIHNPMKIFVPKQEIVLPTQIGLGNVDNFGGSFNRTAPTQLGGEATKWVDRPLSDNLNAARQDQFGEFFFPTIVIKPDDKDVAAYLRMQRSKSFQRRRFA